MTRIIAGAARGRRIATPGHQLTRPTTDRVREALFSAIVSWTGTGGGDRPLRGFSFLDLYAGSGAVALEAASRGAEPVWAVESDRATAALIRTNARTANLSLEVRTQRAERMLAAPARRFAIGWLDPPYDLPGTELATVLGLVADGWIEPGGLVVVERSSRSPEPPWPDSMAATWSRRYGETTLHFAESEEAA